MYFGFNSYLYPKSNKQAKKQTNPQTYWVENVNVSVLSS